MNRSTLRRLAASALMLGGVTLSLPVLSHQVDRWCDSPSRSHAKGPMSMRGGFMGGGNPMGMMGGGPMGMMGGYPMDMMSSMMGDGPRGMIGGMMRGGPMEMMEHMMGGHRMRMMEKYEELGLSDEQKQQINDIHHKLLKKQWQLMGPMIDLNADLQKAYAGDRPDPAAVGAVYGKIFDLRRQMIEAMIEAKNSLNDVLTEEQREQMEHMKHERRGMIRRGQGAMMQQGLGSRMGQGRMMQQGQGGMMGQGPMMQGQSGMMQQGQGGQAN